MSQRSGMPRIPIKNDHPRPREFRTPPQRRDQSGNVEVAKNVEPARVSMPEPGSAPRFPDKMAKAGPLLGGNIAQPQQMQRQAGGQDRRDDAGLGPDPTIRTQRPPRDFSGL